MADDPLTPADRNSLDALLEEVVEINCQTCQGHSLPGARPDEHGHCPTCDGTTFVRVSRYALLTDEQRVEVLEREVLRLRPDLAAQYSPKGGRRCLTP